MKLKKLLAILMVTVVGMTALAGCGKGNAQPDEAQTSAQDDNAVTDGEEAPDDAGDEQGEEAADGEQVLTISTWDNDTSPQFRVIADAFMEANPNVKIEYIDTNADEYKNKLTVMLASGDSDPDIIFVKDTETQNEMKEKGQLLNLDEYIARDGIDFSLYSGIAEQLQMDGSSYSLPFRQDWYVLYYNKDLFDAAGVDYPSADMTWDEYEALAKEMTSGEGSDKVYGSHNHTWMAMVSNWAVQDGKHTLMDYEDYSFLEPYYEQALRMEEEGVVQTYANLKTGSIHYIGVFQEQQCAMLPMGSWFIGTMLQSQADGEIDFNWGVTKIPHPEGVAAGNTVGAATPVAINAQSDVPDLAWEFLKFAVSEEGGMILAENGIFPAAQTDAIVNKLAEIDGFPADGKEALLIEGIVFDRPLHKDMGAVRTVIEEEHDLIMVGEQDVETGLKNMSERAAEVAGE